MNKKPLLGSLLVLTLLLLMPTIPAIQHKVVKDEVLSEIQVGLEKESVGIKIQKSYHSFAIRLLTY